MNLNSVDDTQIEDHGQKTFLHMCELCPSEFSTASELQRHMKVHNKKTYTCFVCSKSFLKKTSLDTHMVSVHGSDWKPCYFCKRKFRTIVAMRKHMKKCGNRPREVIQFTCRQCRLVFDTRDKLDKHMLSHSVKLVACPQCAMRVSIQDFANHQATHVTYHKRCSACGKRFKSEHELVAHVKRDHVSKDRDGLKCTQCGLTFVNKMEFKVCKATHWAAVFSSHTSS